MRKIIITKEQLTEVNTVVTANTNSEVPTALAKAGNPQTKSENNGQVKVVVGANSNGQVPIQKTADNAEEVAGDNNNGKQTVYTVKNQQNSTKPSVDAALAEMKIFTKKELNEKRVKKLSENCIFLTKDELFDLI